MIRRKVFSCQQSIEDIIADIEERAFCAGYEQRMFDAAIDLDYYKLQEENRKREKKRRGGHVMGALGTIGILNHGTGELINSAARTNPGGFRSEAAKKLAKQCTWVNRGALAGATALTAGGLYRINKKANKNLTIDEYRALKEKGEIN